MTLPGRCLAIWLCGFAARPASAADPGVAVLLVDTDRVAGTAHDWFLEAIERCVDEHRQPARLSECVKERMKAR